MRRWVVGTICSITIILVSLASMIQFSNGWTIGDYIFKFLNQPPWSNGSSGIHYSAIDSLLLLLIGAICLRFSLESAPEKLAKRLNIMTLILVLCWLPITYAGEQIVMRFSTGINAIGYDKGISTCNFKVGDDGRIIISAEINLTNHGRRPVTFHMEIKPPSANDDLKRFFGNGLVLKDNDNKMETFELNPGEARTFKIEAYANNSSGLHMSGSMGIPALVLFNEQDEKTFAR
ncbi:hypothetical protein Desaci_2114 [Desulfosporosinus acidiphilus SJ4]|uniref:Uncharacterized protein n=1 Tax=Desulfosporosinus acidiphilus (strain DSM 22704 / JCM 16185 / SJ4) TaxID=646529 RepID=I4D5K8_DESAJ|nr:hypothetical protein [Desulfosporosinus acidiphilus]AFM41082.1 hypothetical protein Desaci_2114 [Desulfosporosinus acidiphilus SJ4]